ncbi:MAG TPA: hypothetical protein PK715_15845, partial [Chitinophagales bacterium]|nr:hypothetical protein [Chitinophagales bacterium]
MATTYILVRSAYPNPTAPFYSCWRVTYKGQRPSILVKQQQTVLLIGAAHRNLFPVLSSASKPH